jgi:hypothetical protein
MDFVVIAGLNSHDGREQIWLIFFDKVKQGIGKEITTVSVKSKEALETAKLKRHIGTLQERKKVHWRSLVILYLQCSLKKALMKRELRVSVKQLED